jgi:hypothetical protein
VSEDPGIRKAESTTLHNAAGIMQLRKRFPAQKDSRPVHPAGFSLLKPASDSAIMGRPELQSIPWSF